MRPISAAARAGSSVSNEAEAVLRELRQTAESLKACLAQLEKVLAQPALDASALISVRLKLAGLRLTRGPLINRVHDLLSGRVTEAQELMLDQSRASHHSLLQTATKHTANWTLEAISKNWPEYRRETRQLMREWVAKATREERLVYPLIQNCLHPERSERHV